MTSGQCLQCPVCQADVDVVGRNDAGCAKTFASSVDLSPKQAILGFLIVHLRTPASKSSVFFFFQDAIIKLLLKELDEICISLSIAKARLYLGS